MRCSLDTSRIRSTVIVNDDVAKKDNRDYVTDESAVLIEQRHPEIV